MATRKAAGGIVTIPVKAATTIAMNGIVCTDSSGYAVPGGDTSGLKFIGIACQGIVNAGANGAKVIKVWTVGIFKMTTTGAAVTVQGATVYATGTNTIGTSSTNHIEVGKAHQFVSATSVWVGINAAANPAGGTGGGTPDDGSVSTVKIVDGAVTVRKLEADLQTTLVPVDADTASKDLIDNVEIYASCIALANSLKSTLNAHAADAAEHASADATNFPIAAAGATDEASLYTLCGELFAAYDAHEGDADQNSGWAFHTGKQTAGHAMDNSEEPAAITTALTRLNDLKAKFNLHDADADAHTDGSTHTVVAADAAPGVTVLAGATIIPWGIGSNGLVHFNLITSTTEKILAAGIDTNGEVYFTLDKAQEGAIVANWIAFRIVMPPPA
jgi:hypothetical protein